MQIFSKVKDPPPHLGKGWSFRPPAYLAKKKRSLMSSPRAVNLQSTRTEHWDLQSIRHSIKVLSIEQDSQDRLPSLLISKDLS